MPFAPKTLQAFWLMVQEQCIRHDEKLTKRELEELLKISFFFGARSLIDLQESGAEGWRAEVDSFMTALVSNADVLVWPQYQEGF